MEPKGPAFARRGQHGLGVGVPPGAPALPSRAPGRIEFGKAPCPASWHAAAARLQALGAFPGPWPMPWGLQVCDRGSWGFLVERRMKLRPLRGCALCWD